MSTTGAMEARMEEQVSGSSAAIVTVVCLGPWYQDATAELLRPLLHSLRQALGSRAASAMVLYPVSDPQAGSWYEEGLSVQPYPVSESLRALHVQAAATYLSLFEMMRAHHASCGLLLGADGQALHVDAIAGMVSAVLDRNADLALPRYTVDPNEALINAAILYPLTRSIFGIKASFPLALDLALSYRGAESMAKAAQRSTAAGQPEGLVWPASEAAVAGFTVAEVPAGRRPMPHPGGELSDIVTMVAGSLFNEIEAKATFWQRTRAVPPILHIEGVSPTEDPTAALTSADEIFELIEGFRIAYGNLHEIWSLVLPPQTLLGLKRLSRAPNENFELPDSLWVRIVYDFVLAHRLRTINRGHLLGSLTPLYLAWVASHLLSMQKSFTANPPESLARAFEADKPYLVSRWRWPDRFNP